MMKHMMMAVGVAGILAMVGTGCTSMETNRVGEQVDVHMPVHIQPEVTTDNKQIEGEGTVHSVLGIFTWGEDTQAVGVNYGAGTGSDAFAIVTPAETVARNAAAYKAVTEAKADLVLAPQYVVTVKDYFVYKNINCKIKGYPGFIKSLKVVDDLYCPH